MDSEFIKKALKKKVFIVIKNKFHYEGKVDKVKDEFVYITDRFGNPVAIRIADIISCEVKQ